MGLLALDAAPRVAAGGPHLAGGRAGPAGRRRTARSGTGSRSRRDRRWSSGRWPRAHRPLHAPGGDRGGPRAGAHGARRRTGPQIVSLYDALAQPDPSPVVELNRAAAVAMRDGPQAGLALIDAILARGDLADYHLAHSARAELCRRLGRTAEARAAYERALEPHAPGAGAAVPRATAERAARLSSACIGAARPPRAVPPPPPSPRTGSPAAGRAPGTRRSHAARRR